MSVKIGTNAKLSKTINYITFEFLNEALIYVDLTLGNETTPFARLICNLNFSDGKFYISFKEFYEWEFSKK